MKFLYYKHFWIDYMKVKTGISCGLHFSFQGLRFDFHFLFWIISFGYKVPVYEDAKGKKFAASNSYDEAVKRDQTKRNTFERYRIRR